MRPVTTGNQMTNVLLSKIQKSPFGTKYSRMDQVKFVENSLQKISTLNYFVPFFIY